MNIIFRADANCHIGMGHVMRCLSLADAAVSLGCHVEFVIADDAAELLIQSCGYKTIVLGSNYTDLDSELGLWPSITANRVLVDSYYVTANYFDGLCQRLKANNDRLGKLVYIDDILAFPYPVDVLVNYNAYASLLDYQNLYAESDVRMPRFILSPIYAPLREQFKGCEKKIQPEEVHNVLISTGGSDELHVSVALIQALITRKSDLRAGCNQTYHFLIGAMNEDKEEIKHLAAREDCIVLHENVFDMKKLITSCDIAISAAGSTLYEISACGVPLITYSLADNQLLGAEAFANLGLAIDVGDLRDPDSIDRGAIMGGRLSDTAADRIISALNKLSANRGKREKMGARMQSLVDGFGADRMVKEIII